MWKHWRDLDLGVTFLLLAVDIIIWKVNEPHDMPAMKTEKVMNVYISKHDFLWNEAFG